MRYEFTVLLLLTEHRIPCTVAVMKIAHEEWNRKPASYLLSNYTTAICRVAFLFRCTSLSLTLSCASVSFAIGTHLLCTNRSSIWIWARRFIVPTLQVSSRWIHCIDLKIASNTISTHSRCLCPVHIDRSGELVFGSANRKNVKRHANIQTHTHTKQARWCNEQEKRGAKKYVQNHTVHELLVHIEVFATEISELGIKSARGGFVRILFSLPIEVQFFPNEFCCQLWLCQGWLIFISAMPKWMPQTQITRIRFYSEQEPKRDCLHEVCVCVQRNEMNKKF